MKLIDTHCHLAHGRLLPQVAAVMDRARAAGVTAVVCATGDLHEAATALGIARNHADVFFLAGIHPHEAKEAPEDYLRRIEQLAADPKCVAVGEIGLDYHYDFSPRDRQRQVFASQLDLARRIGKPAVIHTREAFEDTLAILRDSCLDGSRVVFHSFTGGPEEARRALEFGATLGFSGIVTFRNADELRRSAALTPRDRLLVETDAPYLSPEPVRNMKTNEPANVVHVAARLAAVRNDDPDALGELAASNAMRFFNLPAEKLTNEPRPPGRGDVGM